MHANLTISNEMALVELVFEFVQLGILICPFDHWVVGENLSHYLSISISGIFSENDLWLPSFESVF